MTNTEGKSIRTVLVTLALLAAILGGLWFFGRDRSEQTAFRQTLHITQLLQQLGDALHAAAQSEKQAVMAETDEDSQRFARDARNATDRVSGLLVELKLLPLYAPQETELAARFETAFAEYRKVDEEVLTLAVQNTNVKALALSFGQASRDLTGMEQALQPVLATSSGAAQSSHDALAAQRAVTEALRIQAMHTPHIMEKTGARMDELERSMAASDKQVRAALAMLQDKGTTAKALAAYENYWKMTAEVLRLSRENTNVRSLTLSLERKTKALAMCDEALQALDAQVQERMLSKATR